MSTVPNEAIIGLGGNVGGIPALLERFAEVERVLATHGTIRVAPRYRTDPIGGVDQEPFVNSAIALATEMEPLALLAELQRLELALGRDRAREPRWGPRPIDLDILVWGSRRIDLPELVVPHPRLMARYFALQPLVDLVGPDFVVPGAGVAGELLDAVREQRIERLEP